jgi:hypothetical protein
MLAGKETHDNYVTNVASRICVDDFWDSSSSMQHYTAERMWNEEKAAVIAAGGNMEPVAAPVPAAPPAPPQQTSSQPPLLPRDTPIPANYLKQDEPWRRHLDADGNIVAPYWRPW